MIANSSSLATLQAEWQGVVQMRERIRHLVLSTFALDANKSPAFGDVLYNLPLVLAFDVLGHALLEASDDERFAASRHELGNLMDRAKTALEWIDWQGLREGVKRRNEPAQNEKLFGDSQCLYYMAVIEAQLVAWGILTVAEPGFPPSFPRVG
jgi:hypothetical protein